MRYFLKFLVIWPYLGNKVFLQQDNVLFRFGEPVEQLVSVG